MTFLLTLFLTVPPLNAVPVLNLGACMALVTSPSSKARQNQILAEHWEQSTRFGLQASAPDLAFAELDVTAFQFETRSQGVSSHLIREFLKVKLSQFFDAVQARTAITKTDFGDLFGKYPLNPRFIRSLLRRRTAWGNTGAAPLPLTDVYETLILKRMARDWDAHRSIIYDSRLEKALLAALELSLQLGQPQDVERAFGFLLTQAQGPLHWLDHPRASDSINVLSIYLLAVRIGSALNTERASSDMVAALTPIRGSLRTAARDLMFAFVKESMSPVFFRSSQSPRGNLLESFHRSARFALEALSKMDEPIHGTSRQLIGQIADFLLNPAVAYQDWHGLLETLIAIEDYERVRAFAVELRRSTDPSRIDAAQHFAIVGRANRQ